MDTTSETYFVEAQLSQHSSLARRNATILVVGFAAIILVGTFLLMLPASSAMERPLTFMEALFTATSATTVTGLVVLTTATDLSLFGQLVVLLLIEVGGVGFIAFSVVLFALIGRRLGVAER
ncbi:MAG: Trk family potassium uptake protein, partial [Ardenticatenia bacterium]